MPGRPRPGTHHFVERLEVEPWPAIRRRSSRGQAGQPRDRGAVARHHGLERPPGGERGLGLDDLPSTRSSANMTWRSIGCSTHNVPSWSKVAMRSAGGTNCGPAASVVFTKSTIACLAGRRSTTAAGRPPASAARRRRAAAPTARKAPREGRGKGWFIIVVDLYAVLLSRHCAAAHGRPARLQPSHELHRLRIAGVGGLHPFGHAREASFQLVP